MKAINLVGLGRALATFSHLILLNLRVCHTSKTGSSRMIKKNSNSNRIQAYVLKTCKSCSSKYMHYYAYEGIWLLMCVKR